MSVFSLPRFFANRVLRGLHHGVTEGGRMPFGIHNSMEQLTEFNHLPWLLPVFPSSPLLRALRVLRGESSGVAPADV